MLNIRFETIVKVFKKRKCSRQSARASGPSIGKSIQPSSQMGKGKKRAAPAVAARQVQLERLPLLKKPLEQIGKYINVPGKYWEGRMSAAEKEEKYKCVVREHSAMAVFAGRKAEGFQLQEMGVTGTGSLEHGDASGEIFWMEYPFPFLTYFYDTYPNLRPDAPERTPAAPQRTSWRSTMTQTLRPVPMCSQHSRTCVCPRRR